MIEMTEQISDGQQLETGEKQVWLWSGRGGIFMMTATFCNFVVSLSAPQPIRNEIIIGGK